MTTEPESGNHFQRKCKTHNSRVSKTLPAILFQVNALTSSTSITSTPRRIMDDNDVNKKAIHELAHSVNGTPRSGI